MPAPVVPVLATLVLVGAPVAVEPAVELDDVPAAPRSSSAPGDPHATQDTSTHKDADRTPRGMRQAYHSTRRSPSAGGGASGRRGAGASADLTGRSVPTSRPSGK